MLQTVPLTPAPRTGRARRRIPVPPAVRGRLAVLTALLCTVAAAHGQGLRLTTDTEMLWPRLQLRTAAEPAAGLTAEGLVPPTRTLSRAPSLVLADYYRAPTRWQAFGLRWEGATRATGGLLAAPGRTRLSGGALATAFGPDTEPAAAAWAGAGEQATPALWPYIGVGYTGLSHRSGWGFSADIGLIARPSGGDGAVGSGLPLDATAEDTLRRIRLDPLVRLGVRYAF